MKIGIIGGGAAGTLAAIECARRGASVTLIEKNEKVGKKLYITGKGRCNLTNDCEVNEFLQNVVHGDKFLRSALYGFDSQATMAYFEDMGLDLVTERGNRVFPKSQKSADVLDAIKRELKKQRVNVMLSTLVDYVTPTLDGFQVGISADSQKQVLCFDKVIVATGGLTYPSTGSTGDGYSFAKRLGHSIVTPVGSLNSIVTVEDVKSLEGISLKNVQLSAMLGGKTLASEFGEMLFTSDGMSGPIVLSLSARVNRFNGVSLILDLKPALSYEILDARLLREFDAAKNQNLKNVMRTLLPERMISYVLSSAAIDGDKKVNSLTKDERISIEKALKELPFTMQRLSSIDGAVVTSGGVNLKEVNPSTMESKLVKGLYFAGEVMDVDALTGGFNLQIAFATAYAAASSACEEGQA